MGGVLIAPKLHAAVLDHDLITATLVKHMPLPALAGAPPSLARWRPVAASQIPNSQSVVWVTNQMPSGRWQ